MKDVSVELYCRRPLRIIDGECDPELQDSIGIVSWKVWVIKKTVEPLNQDFLTLVYEEDGIPDQYVFGRWCDVHSQRTMRFPP